MLNRNSWIAPSGCTISVENGTCGGTIPAGAPISACGKHLSEAYTYCAEILKDKALENVAPPKKRKVTKNSVIYYVRIGDAIKIGTTTDLERRLQNLHNGELLVTEPGDSFREATRHRQFAHLKKQSGRGRELFHPSTELMDHIEGLKLGVEYEPA